MEYEELLREIKEAQHKLNELLEEKSNYKENWLINTYGKRYSCKYCRYSCIEEIGDHNYCGNHNCTCCHDNCDGYQPDNRLSMFIKQHSPINNKFHENSGTIDMELHRVLKKLFGEGYLNFDYDSLDKDSRVEEFLKWYWRIENDK